MENEETNADLENKRSWINKSTRLTSVNFDATLHGQARKNNISLRDAIEFGIMFKIADAEGLDYPECNLSTKLTKLAKKLALKSQECEALREQLAGAEEEDLNKEVDDILGGCIKE